MLRPFHIALLELKRYVGSKGELAFSLALPVVLFALMYGAFGGETSFHATAEIVDLDQGVHSRALIDTLDTMEEITVRERTLDDANQALGRSAILTTVVIPAGFSAGLAAGEPVAITFKKRGNGGDTGQIVEAIVRSVAEQMTGQIQVRATVSNVLSDKEIPQDRIDSVVSQRLSESSQSPSVGVETRSVGGDESDAIDRLLPGLLVMFLMFAVTMNAQTLVDERRNGTLERLMTTRLGVNQLFVGKFMAGVLRAVVQALVLLALAFVVLRIGDALDFVELAVFSALVAMAVSAMGLVIGSVARTQDQAIWAAVFVTMFMTVFGGTFFDLTGAGPLDLLSKFTLNRHAIDSMFGMLAAGQTLAGQGVGIAVHVGVSVVGLVVARALFSVSEGGR